MTMVPASDADVKVVALRRGRRWADYQCQVCGHWFDMEQIQVLHATDTCGDIWICEDCLRERVRDAKRD